jgi:hypothetical protein
LLTILLIHLLYRNSFAAKRRHVILSKHLQVLPRLETRNHALIPKREGPKIHSSTTDFNEPRRPCSLELLDTVQTSENAPFTNCLLDHHKIKDMQELCSHTTTKQISRHMSPASPIHTHSSTKRECSYYIADLYTFRKHKLPFSPMFTKTPTS